MGYEVQRTNELQNLLVFEAKTKYEKQKEEEKDGWSIDELLESEENFNSKVTCRSLAQNYDEYIRLYEETEISKVIEYLAITRALNFD